MGLQKTYIFMLLNDTFIYMADIYDQIVFYSPNNINDRLIFNEK